MHRFTRCSATLGLVATFGFGAVFELSATFCLSATLRASSAAQQLPQFIDERIACVTDLSKSTARIFAGDIDGDGATDLVVGSDSQAADVRRGGAGGFGHADFIDHFDIYGALVDLNADGRADLLGEDTTSFGYAPGLSDASFAATVKIGSSQSGQAILMSRAADINGDGNIDVVVSVANTQPGAAGWMRWHAGNGIGGFGPGSSTPANPYTPRFGLGDFNQDGFVDVAGASVSSNQLYVYASSGSALGAPQALGASANEVAVGDFDADGTDDVACVGGAGAPSWLRGGPAGLAHAALLSLLGASGLGHPHVADLEGDGDDDLLVRDLSFSPTTFRLLKCLGQPVLGLGAAVIEPDVPADAVTTLEYDGEPGLDLAYTQLFYEWPTLRPGDGAGGFAAPLTHTVSATCTDAQSVCAADIDRDGALDLAFESGAWLRGDGAGGFGAEAVLGAHPSQLVDVDGDGWLDALSLRDACGGLAFERQSAPGVFTDVPLAQINLPIGFEIADLDSDGDLDIAVASKSAVGSFAYLQSGGSFGAPFASGLSGPCTTLAIGDLDEDGYADVARTQHTVIFGSPKTQMSWGFGNGTGALTNVITRPIIGTSYGELVLDDIDGDHDLDALWTNGAYVNAMAGDGAGGLAGYTIEVYGTAGMHALVLADIDGDGARDICAGETVEYNGLHHVLIAQRTASGFEHTRSIAAGMGVAQLIAADFDSDGRADLAWGSGGNARVALSLPVDPSGIAPFGVGTAGCRGRASISSYQTPRIGNAEFRLVAQNLPARAFGWFALGSAGSASGGDPFGLGALLHVDPLAGGFSALYPTAADAGGQADRLFAVPSDTQLVGAALFAQSLHVGTLGDACSSSPLALVSSRGVALTIQP